MKLTVFASGSRGNAYLLETPDGAVLLDAGLPYRQLVIGGLLAVLVTHEHKDHSKAAAEFARRGVPVVTSKGTAEAIGLTQYKRLADGEWARFGAVTAQAFAAQHDAAEPLGFVVTVGGKRLVYATDTYYLKYRIPGVNYWVIECNFCEDLIDEGDALDRRRQRSHMGLERLKTLFAANDLTAAEWILLVHLSDAKSDEWRMVQEIAHATGVETVAARKGLTICN